MKFFCVEVDGADLLSLPVRGAWIEIVRSAPMPTRSQSLPVRGAWIEIFDEKLDRWASQSLPVRGAWIEIRKVNV